MKKVSWLDRYTKPMAALLGAVALLTLAACGGGGTGTTSPQTPTGSLGVSPGAVRIEFGSAPVTLTVSGGVKPYLLTSSLQTLIPVISSINEDGRFNITPSFAPDIETVVTLTIRDGQQGITTAVITIPARLGVPLAVSPTSADTGINVPVTFTITGGSEPYTVTSSQPAIVPNPIAVNAGGRFTVVAITNPTVSTAVVLTVRDSRNATVTATLTVRSLALAVSPTTAKTIFGVPVAYQISGGQPPYTVQSSFPTIVANPTVDSNGRFTITPLLNPPAPVDMVLTIRDSAGSQVTTALQITPIPLSVTPTAVTVAADVPVVFTITGGTTPYTVVSSLPGLVPNPTTIDAQGRFTLRATSTPSVTTPVLITIRDAAQNVVTATMTVLATTPVPLSIQPQTATVYYNTPATLTVIGGSPPYQAFSNNSVVLPVARAVVTDQILLAPANVAADTQVIITVVDSSSTTVTATVTVKPAPLLNTLTITPTPATPGVGCGSAVCAGQTASVTVVVRNLAGAGIQGRAVRFENVQGNYQFLTNPPGSPETLANSITVTTGQDGLAVVRLKADVNAPTQVALIRATELTTGNVLNSSFVIAQFTDGAGTLTAIPTTWTVTGPNSSNCAANTSVTYYIFGGTPPYRIQSTLPGFASITPELVLTNGGGFTAFLTGTICSAAPGVAITITDATGRTIAVQLINATGAGNPPTNFDSMDILPGGRFGNIPAPAVLGCGQTITEQIIGGNIRLADGSTVQSTFVISSISPDITATLSGRVITIKRNDTFAAGFPTLASPTGLATIFVSNGFATTSFDVTLDPKNCGGIAPPTSVIIATPNPLLIACAGPAPGPAATGAATITGGTGPFTLLVGAGLSAVVSTNIVTVTRTATVLAGSTPIPVVITDTPSSASTILQVGPATTPGCL